jgi:hypothetical protein
MARHRIKRGAPRGAPRLTSLKTDGYALTVAAELSLTTIEPPDGMQPW